MKLLMDADCLIKLTKAGLNEVVCDHDQVAIPEAVRREVVDEGRARGFADAEVVERNLQRGVRTTVTVGDPPQTAEGDDGLVEQYRDGGHDLVATDDAKLQRRLRGLGVPCVVPALLVYRLRRRGILDGEAARAALAALAPFISHDELSTVRLLLEEDR
jgi:rRNA-processing protein FCF1